MSDAMKAHKLLKKEQRVANHRYREKKRKAEQLCMLVDPNFWSVQVEQEELPALLQKKPDEIPVANVGGQKCYINPNVKVKRA